MTKWKSKLSKAELEHLDNVSYGEITLNTIKSSCAKQKEWRDQGDPEPCHTCKGIAQKLGLPV